MLSIAVLALSEPGHVNATLRLYRELTGLGHDVRYLAAPEDGDFFSTWQLPRASISESRASDGRFVFSVEGFRPDVLLVDASMPHAAVHLWSTGIPMIKMSTVFPQRYDPVVPPLGTTLMPGGDARASIAAAWDRQHQRNRERRPTLRDLAAAVDFPCELIDERAALEVTVNLPELALVPEELDFPRAHRGDLFYAGACVDIGRPESANGLMPVARDRPLIYCSFGTQVHRYSQFRHRVSVVLDAARELGGLQFVIASSMEPPAVPPNVFFCEKAPQLAVLRRAALMISHGGMNGIKEALCFGVPLIVLPFDLDQPGNAARIEYHGLGRRLEWERTDGSALAGAVQQALGDAEMAARARGVASRLSRLLDEQRAASAFASCWQACTEAYPSVAARSRNVSAVRRNYESRRST